MSTLFVATRNLHKVQEIQEILGPGHCCLTLRDLPEVLAAVSAEEGDLVIPDVVEDAPTFQGNATKKAVALAAFLSRNRRLDAKIDYLLADDSGLEVDALNGDPGVHSARFAALDKQQQGNSSDADNNAKLLRLLADVPPEKRTARFRCVVALTPLLEERGSEVSSPVCYANEAELTIRLFNGACEGTILSAPRGASGFGYDPLFVPNGFKQTYAELGEEVKNKISHRARAVQQVKKFLAT
jgi:XTP/dITP diphosphohydrolase